MKTKIVVLGLGGVGGYYGGMLARRYNHHPDVEIYFVARGAHLQKIKDSGLKVLTEEESFTAYPVLATSNAAEIGTADYIIITTKSYDLDATVEQIKPIVGGHTVILPLLNGIDITARIRKLLPGTEVWNGCTYIVGRLNEPGVVESSGNVHIIYFGCDNKTNERLLYMEKLMRDAGIDARFSPEILTVVWKKFFFISSTASLTSYFDVSFGALLDNEIRKNTLIDLLNELLLVAHAENININESIKEEVIRQLEALPYKTTSSMHSDFMAKRNTELQTLTGIVVELAGKYSISIPTYKKVYSALKAVL